MARCPSTAGLAARIADHPSSRILPIQHARRPHRENDAQRVVAAAIELHAHEAVLAPRIRDVSASTGIDIYPGSSIVLACSRSGWLDIVQFPSNWWTS